jgi:signal peptidase I
MNRNYSYTKKNPLSVWQLEKELKRERYKSRYRRTVRSTVFALITVAAAAVLIATLWLPVLQIYGSSMAPTLNRGEVVVSVKGNNVKQGDIIAFYYNNKILVKRVIAGPGDWVNIDADGTVYVNDEPLQEDYLKEKSLGECDITLPYQVPESRYFVMGDHRSTSVDSRSSSIGCVSEEQIVGKLAFRVWPLGSVGNVG